ncbi:uncharacterized protein F4822DRAFT_286952 [Hypoxylon trugodes]|uniref:uncharacterized protein n=1 Tax=Hypoxylon trugodes TaxID=326681 RepID=UPI00219027A3|nr:uncharacterized protein F4822DRAFT_286952 [Hypoxylon trugodes]KAI1387568.1 hypothetical protein F4822DRAFT_286952 [Hypoxylon trugodes]
MFHDYSYETVCQNEDAQVGVARDDQYTSNDKRHSNPIQDVRGVLACRSIYFFLNGMLLIISFVLGSTLHPLSLSRLNNSSNLQNQSNPNAFIPPLPIETKVFEFDGTFADDPSPNVTSAWVSLIPKGQGLVRLPLHHEFDGNIFNIAAYHSLHCLFTLRESFFLFYQVANNSARIDTTELASKLKHGRHCIEYIRQNLMCNPDLNLEPIEGGTGNLKEWGIQHQCKSLLALSKWSYEMRASDNEGIAT